MKMRTGVPTEEHPEEREHGDLSVTVPSPPSTPSGPGPARLLRGGQPSYDVVREWGSKDPGHLREELLRTPGCPENDE
jgi:hypothetical protein